LKQFNRCSVVGYYCRFRKKTVKIAGHTQHYANDFVRQNINERAMLLLCVSNVTQKRLQSVRQMARLPITIF